MTRRTVVLLLALALLIPGCARVPKPPIASTGRAAAPTHVVTRGETLYRIAKSYKIDYRDLMRANHISDASQLKVGQELVIPGGQVPPVVERAPVSGGMSVEEIRRLIAVPKLGHWKTITVHHSATRQGGAVPFNRDHLRRHMGGLFYHFVIGNGTLTRDGEIEVGFRWKKQIKANRPLDIQICLVGDFSRDRVSRAQLETVENLIRVLMEECRIPVSAIRKHSGIKGRHTECPGRFFPFEEMLSDLKKSS